MAKLRKTTKTRNFESTKFYNYFLFRVFVPSHFRDKYIFLVSICPGYAFLFCISYS